jgi:diacylglycerol kinase (ATP)
MERLVRATLNTWNGLANAARTERAVQEELFVLLLALPFSFLLGSTMARRVELIGVLMLLLVVEMLNTAIEKLADRVSTDHDPQIGFVKDMGSAAVGITIAIAGLTWLVALAETIGLI